MRSFHVRRLLYALSLLWTILSCSDDGRARSCFSAGFIHQLDTPQWGPLRAALTQIANDAAALRGCTLQRIYTSPSPADYDPLMDGGIISVLLMPTGRPPQHPWMDATRPLYCLPTYEARIRGRPRHFVRPKIGLVHPDSITERALRNYSGARPVYVRNEAEAYGLLVKRELDLILMPYRPESIDLSRYNIALDSAQATGGLERGVRLLFRSDSATSRALDAAIRANQTTIDAAVIALELGHACAPPGEPTGPIRSSIDDVSRPSPALSLPIVPPVDSHSWLRPTVPIQAAMQPQVTAAFVVASVALLAAVSSLVTALLTLRQQRAIARQQRSHEIMMKFLDLRAQSFGRGVKALRPFAAPRFLEAPVAYGQLRGARQAISRWKNGAAHLLMPPRAHEAYHELVRAIDAVLGAHDPTRDADAIPLEDRQEIHQRARRFRGILTLDLTSVPQSPPDASLLQQAQQARERALKDDTSYSLGY